MINFTKIEIEELLEQAFEDGAQSRYMIDRWKKGEISDEKIIEDTQKAYRPQTFAEKAMADFFEDED